MRAIIRRRNRVGDDNGCGVKTVNSQFLVTRVETVEISLNFKRGEPGGNFAH